jgi:hypothetical protein
MASPSLLRSVCVPLLLVATNMPALAGDEPKCAQPQPVSDQTYKPGQVWTYNARPGEAESTITILRVESTPKLGVIVHVRIDGFHLKNCSGGPSPTTQQHAPFAKAAIDKSVVKLLRTDSEIPDYEQGYNNWLSHCGGVYTISVAEMLDVNEKTFNKGMNCSD